ncbi:Vitellogenin-like protein [Melia azedarach]|uniref:Vitellogenin-like protein n=1 Tax=Melia azedarach TaxID=155640 RepID=A0ACC1YER8_MELAZ|nr:Vitellogenin-like protein [Melia azedarach]
MEGIKGGGRVGVGDNNNNHHHQQQEDMGDGMQCSDHPYRNNPGGICAFCLQEKLGKLVSSSFPLPIRGSSSSSSSPSFRSDIGVGSGVASNGVTGTASSASLSLSLSARPTSTKSRNDNGNDRHYQEYYTRRARIPFLLAKKKKKIMVASSDRAADIVFKRSKSTTTPRRGHFLDAATDDGEEFSPRKRSGFWSFLYHSSSSRSNTASKKMEKITTLSATTTATASANGSHVKSRERCLGSSLSRKSDIVIEEDDDSPNSQATASASASSFERKVSRSRSVGCGSRSFSGDFFERISTGFGDCTLRRVESQREGKPKVNAASSHMKERVKCGGIFDHHHHVNGKSASGVSAAGPLAHGRSKSWGWAFASPMRAFGKPSSSKDGKRDHIIRESANKNTTPNLAAIPSLLAVRG